MSLNFMQMSIKTLELQKASLEAMRGGSRGIPTSARKPREHACNRGDIEWR